jgi:hypothetical protein
VRWTFSTASIYGSTDSSLNEGIRSHISGHDLIIEGVSSGSNLGRRNQNERRSFTGMAGAVAQWSNMTVAPTLVRSGFLGHGPWLSTGISSKWRGARGGSHIGQRSSWEAALAARDGGATPSSSVDDGG